MSTKAKQEEHKKQEAAAVNKTLLSIDYTSVYLFNNFQTYPFSIPIPENIPITDYHIKVQKKKKRPSRRAPAEAEIEEDKMDVDQPVVPRVRDLDANFVDDDELQAALARSRKAKLHKVRKLTPEELAKKSKLIFIINVTQLIDIWQLLHRESRKRKKEGK